MSELSDLFERYTTLIGAMQQLEEEVPIIEEAHANLRRTIEQQEKLTADAALAIKKQMETAVKDAEQAKNDVAGAMKSFENISKKIDISSAQAKELLQEVEKKTTVLTELLKQYKIQTVTIALLEKRIAKIEDTVKNLGTTTGSSFSAGHGKEPKGEYIYPSMKASFPKDAYRFTFDSIQEVSRKKPYGIVIEGDIIRAEHWNALLDEVFSFVIEEYDVDVDDLCEQEYGQPEYERLYFVMGKVTENAKYYRYISKYDFSVYYGGAALTVDVISQLLCDYLKINPQNVELFYHR